MPECARCGDFTDNPASKDYHYCDNCIEHFNYIRNHGVTVRSVDDQGNYAVTVNLDGHEDTGGREASQIDALARGKKTAEDLGVQAMFEYTTTGSQWDLDTYLVNHPDIRAGVYDRLSRVPPEEKNILQRIFSRFRV